MVSLVYGIIRVASDGWSGTVPGSPWPPRPSCSYFLCRESRAQPITPAPVRRPPAGSY
jgi:hypothetical protein